MPMDGKLCEELLQHGCGRLFGSNDGALFNGQQGPKEVDGSVGCCG